MKPWILFVAALLSFGCSNGAGVAPEGNTSSAAEKLGQISLDLLGSDPAGNPYRLRNATFDIRSFYLFVDNDGGPVSETVSSETHPNASTITTRLLPGEYAVTLENGWFLEKGTGRTAKRVDQAILLNDATLDVYVCDHCNASVYYAFGVDGTLIDFVHGDLNIQFNVVHPDADAGAPDGG